MGTSNMVLNAVVLQKKQIFYSSLKMPERSINAVFVAEAIADLFVPLNK